MKEIRSALLSVYDKTGLVELATALSEQGVRLVSTGGTARHLVAAGLEVVQIEEYTGSPEMLGGRVKTLHPHVFGGILARRESVSQLEELSAAGLDTIDLVVVNLYPFAETVAAPDHTLMDALEQIDIGGVSLLRAAYKNFSGCAVVVDPADYPSVAAGSAGLSLPARLALAKKAVAHTAAYEAAICNYITSIDQDGIDLGGVTPRAPHPEHLALTFTHRQSLRYGENPHQPAAFYSADGEGYGLGAGKQLQGKELSFNNYLDTDAAWQLAWSLPVPGAAVIKHANPCGAGTSDALVNAYRHARATDPLSAFGGIVGLNEVVDDATAHEVVTTFIEVVVAPGFSAEALEILKAKPNLRLLELPAPTAEQRGARELRWVSGGALLQSRDFGAEEQWVVVSERQPNQQENADLLFLWDVVPAVKSNAIVIGRNGQLLGVGAGQMSRVDSCRFAALKAQDAGHDLRGSAAASDAFFPFPDGVETLADAGVTAIVQPGGSKRDDEVIAAANRLGLVLVHTGTRHFRH
ncbi:MAG: bifunctional phosphoribosylaminoimidazolecarboxamide formyltransferase/IMP cyclohydrolase [Acidobacteria bacterium]|nr:bifunctional phosphoribosylaminoimidazolecarboxamide formyltransferase/IMP cyclohydrolase [Acidobacteriota bacterium]